MEFRTVVKPLDGYRGLISHNEPVLMIGSCFTDNIGACLRDDLFDVTVNPFGPIYNPASVEHAVAILADDCTIEPRDLFMHEGRYHSFFFHSRYSGTDPEETARIMTSRIHSAHESLAGASALIVTLGTIRVFRSSCSTFVVANCHKLPASEFDEELLSLSQCITSLESIVEISRTVNPDLKVIFTVSPLRYLGQGAHGNTLAKATLALAIEDVVSRYHGVHYFPSFEIMMDDLRDYRFYADDMKHPTDQAVRYIYENFSATYFTPETMALAEKARRVTRRLAHRSMGGRADNGTDDKNRIITDFITALPQLATNIDRYISNGIQYS